MNLTGRQHGTLRRSLRAMVWACVLLALAGCKTIPGPTRRTVEELYLEAQSIAKPETTLGMDHPAHPLPHELVAPPMEVLATSEVQEPVTPTPVDQPLLPPEMLPLPGDASQPAPLPTETSAQPLSGPPASGPVKPVAHAAQPGASQGVVPATSTSAPGEVLLSDIFEQTDVRQALQGLADRAGMSIVMDDTARGEVTCTINNETFEQALRKIVLPLGLVYKRKENLYLIGTSDPTSNMFPHIAESIEFRPNHLSAQELMALLPTRQNQFVRTVEKRNLIVIEAPHDTAQQIQSQLLAADQPVPQIMIEAVVCVVAPDKGLQFGMDWNHVLKVQGVDALNVGLSGLAFNGSASPHGVNNAFDDFAITSAFVKLLAKEGYVSIRAAPRVMAKDGEKADISIARDTFFSIQQGGNQFLFRQDIEKVESGISLILTPTIRGDNVQIVIEKAEVSEDIRTIDSAQDLTNNPFPIINRRRVTTTVQVKDRQTIAIGGLVGRQTVERESRIPGLGSIPGIGRAFRKIEKTEQDAEVVIFISPKIVIPTAQPSAFPEGMTPLTNFQTVPTVPTEGPAVAPTNGPVIPNLRVVPGD